MLCEAPVRPARPQGAPTMRVLLVEDDESLCAMLADYLAGHGVALTCVHRGDEAVAAFQAAAFDAVLLDVMLPGKDGFAVLAALRQLSSCPVLMLTARGEESDRVLGLESGAADYIAKPFSARELLARLRAAQRLYQSATATGQTVESSVLPARIEVDAREGIVRLGTVRVELTHVECVVLRVLLAGQGEPVRRETLYREALGREVLPYDRSLDTHISNLRRKLEAGAAAGVRVRIRSIRGIGYLLLQ